VFRTNKFAFQNCHADQCLIFEYALEYSAAVVAIKKYRRVKIRFTWRPALHIEVSWLQYQISVVQMVNIFDDLAAVDLPDQRNFSALKRANVHRIYGVGVVLRIIRDGSPG
jgi:hypothetical protein